MTNKNNYIFGAYCAAVLIQNILALKTVNLSLITVTTGILISPVVFILQDVETELYGFKTTKHMIITAYIMNFIFILLSTLAIWMKPSPAYTMQEAFSSLFSTTPRIVTASFLAYITGSLFNSWIMNMNRDRHGLFYRAVTSTVAGQILDNSIFAFVAFWGSLPLGAIVSMIIGATMLETIYEVIVFPVTRMVISILKKHD